MGMAVAPIQLGGGSGPAQRPRLAISDLSVLGADLAVGQWPYTDRRSGDLRRAVRLVTLASATLDRLCLCLRAPLAAAIVVLVKPPGEPQLEDAEREYARGYKRDHYCCCHGVLVLSECPVDAVVGALTPATAWAVSRCTGQSAGKT